MPRIAGVPRYKGCERTRLIRAREMLKLERRELAQIMGVEKTCIFRIETGQRNPSLRLMTRWAQALGIGPHAALELFLVDWPAPGAYQQKPAA